MKANSEDLPFEDASFDCYIANLSLMLVDNPQNMLSEAYRVLQDGSYAGFTVWGNQDHCNQFLFLTNTLNKLGIENESDIPRAFAMNDKTKLRKLVIDAGFNECKIFTSSGHISHESHESYLKMQKSSFDNKMKALNYSKKDATELWEKVEHEYYSKFGPESDNVIDFETIICIAKK